MSAVALKERLRADLKAAMRDRQSSVVGVIRTVIAAIDNAEAVPVERFHERLRRHESIEEIARRELDPPALDAVLTAEIHSRLAAAEDYERNGRTEEGAGLRHEADLISRYRA